MINLNFSIGYPFSDRFEIVASTSKLLTKYKAVEANMYRTATIIKLSLAYSIRRDHAGLQLEFGLFGYDCELNFYDTRHWDYKTHQWE
jgi:hypothetical protein